MSKNLKCNSFEAHGSGGLCEEDGLLYRTVRPSDMDGLRTLHEELFPIRYEDKYYHSAVEGRGFFGQSMQTIIAEEQTSGEIIGFIFYQFLDQADVEDRGLFRYDPPKVCYILVFGLTARYRRKGIGSKLMEMCLDDCRNNPLCGGIYLHVIEYNTAAMAFYRRCGLDLLRISNAFYTIDGRDYDAHIYILYMNGYEMALMDKLHILFRQGSSAVVSGILQIYRYIFPTEPTPPLIVNENQGQSQAQGVVPV